MSVATIRAVWAGERRWDTGRPDGPTSRLDGAAETGQSPVDGLLSAVAACSGIDVVDILAKRRTPVSAVTIDVEAERRAEPPRRVTLMRLVYRIEGAGVERVHAERAVGLAFEKYCSVACSLVPDVAVTTVVVLNGERGEERGQQIINS